MEKCPTCGRVYQDNLQKFCVEDGTMLVKVSTAEDNTVSFYDLPQTSSFPQPQFQTTPFQTMPTVQAKKKSSLLLFGGIGAAVLILLIGAAGAVFLIARNSSGGGGTNANYNVNVANGKTDNQKSLGEKYKPELMMAIKSADNAEINAYATYDTATLKNYYAGEALKAGLANIEELKRLKIYHLSNLENQEYEYFKVNDAENEAEVRLTETWTTTVMQTPSGKCLEMYKSRKIPQTIYLKKTSTGWMVNVINHDPGIKNIPSPCPTTGK